MASGGLLVAQKRYRCHAAFGTLLRPCRCNTNLRKHKQRVCAIFAPFPIHHTKIMCLDHLHFSGCTDHAQNKPTDVRWRCQGAITAACRIRTAAAAGSQRYSQPTNWVLYNRKGSPNQRITWHQQSVRIVQKMSVI